MKKIIIFITLLTFTSIANSAGKINLLTKNELKKLDKIEQEYYLKKLIKHYSDFEVRMSKGKKLVTKINFSLPQLFNSAYASSYTEGENCIVAGHILEKNPNKTCKIGGLFTKKCNKAKSQSQKKKLYFQCGPIYGGVCMEFRNKGRHMSKDCAKAVSDNIDPKFIGEMKKNINLVCRGDNFNSDGCINIMDAINYETNIAKIFEKNILANEYCEHKSQGSVNNMPDCTVHISGVVNGSRKTLDLKYTEDDRDELISAINNQSVNIPDFESIDVGEIVKKYKVIKCNSLKVPAEFKSTLKLIDNKCPSVLADYGVEKVEGKN